MTRIVRRRSAPVPVEELLRGSGTRDWGLHGRSVRKYAIGALVETRREEEYWWLREAIRHHDSADANELDAATCGHPPSSWGAP